MIENVKMSLDEGKVVCMIPMDLSRPFDGITLYTVHIQTWIVLNKDEVLYKFLFGFRKNNFTFILVNISISTIDKGRCFMGLFLDFIKAFDAVSHQTLLINIVLAVLQIHG